MGDDPPARDPIDLSATRLEAFSDAVMAVIITILALELHPPADATPQAVRDELPSLAIYVLAFAFIAIYWNNHHHLLRATTRISGAVMWSNMFLLLWLSLIPVLTEWLRNEGDQPLPVASFGMVALGAAFAYWLLVRAIIHANGRDSLVASAISSDVKGSISIVLYAAGIGLAYLWWPGAYILYVAVAVMWIIPDRRFLRSTT